MFNQIAIPSFSTKLSWDATNHIYVFINPYSFLQWFRNFQFKNLKEETRSEL